MPDDVQEAVSYMSEALQALLCLCEELVEPDSDEMKAVAEIKAAKAHYDDVLRGAKLLPARGGDSLSTTATPKSPLDLVGLAEQMSSSGDPP